MSPERSRRPLSDIVIPSEGLPPEARQALVTLYEIGFGEVMAVMTLRAGLKAKGLTETRVQGRIHLNTLQGQFLRAETAVKKSTPTDESFDPDDYVIRLETMRKLMMAALTFKKLRGHSHPDIDQVQKIAHPGNLWDKALGDGYSYPANDNAKAFSALVFKTGGRKISSVDAREFNTLATHHMDYFHAGGRPMGVADVWTVLFRAVALDQFPPNANSFLAEGYSAMIGRLVEPFEEKAATAAEKIRKHN